jgi:tetratricopeptide (TPR) repeat protein
MRAWLLPLAGLIGLLGVGLSVMAPLRVDAANSTGEFPEDWRELDSNDPRFPALPPRRFDFGDGFGMQWDGRALRDGLGRADRPPSRRRSTKPLENRTPAARAPTSDEIRAEALKKALGPQESPAAVRKRMLDALFQQLHGAKDSDEAKGVALAIERIWLQSRSDTANLLMERALVSIRSRHYPLALTLLDQLVALEPEWAEAWNQRATTRFLANDVDGAMADIDQVMKLEPRHFGALAGMGAILQRAGLGRRALQVFNKALEVYPQQPDLQATVDKLTIEVEGRDI